MSCFRLGELEIFILISRTLELHQLKCGVWRDNDVGALLPSAFGSWI